MAFLADIAVQRLKANHNILIGIFGPPGSSKSYSSIAEGDIIDPSFSVMKVVFSVREFMTLINTRDGEGDRIVNPGSVIVFEEAGVEIDAQKWYKDSNQIMKYVMETFRRDRIGVIFNAPIKEMIDSKIQALFHYVVLMVDPFKAGTPEKPKYGVGNIYEVAQNIISGKHYLRFPEVYKDGKYIKLSSSSMYDGNIQFMEPREKLRDAYEEKSRIYKQSVQKKGLELLLGIMPDWNERRIIRYICEQEKRFLNPKNIKSDKDGQPTGEYDKVKIQRKVKNAMFYDFPDVKIKLNRIKEAVEIFVDDPNKSREAIDKTTRNVILTADDFEGLEAIFERRKDWFLVALELDIPHTYLYGRLKEWMKKDRITEDQAKLNHYQLWKRDITGTGVDLDYRARYQ